MRKEIPKFTDQLSTKDFLNIIVDSFQTVIFSTVDKEDHARSMRQILS